MTTWRPVRKIRAPEIWKQYLDTDYWVSDQGRVKRVYKSGKEYEVGWYSDSKTNPQMCMKLYGEDVYIKTIVWKTFKGEIPKGYVIAHRNGLKRDNSIYNLYLTKRRDLGILTGHRSRSKKVIDLSSGKIYRSARQAGRNLFCSNQMVIDTCNNKVQKPQVDVYWWDEEAMKAYRGKWHTPKEVYDE